MTTGARFSVNPAKRALAILGPTAIGKTAVAMAIADEIPAHLISVDSAMVFKQMNIGTAKPSAEELRRYPHALVDLIDPLENYSAADFLRDARKELEFAWSAGKLPIFVGGTMLYFKALREGLAQMPDRDPAVRARLEAEVASVGLAGLHTRLAAVDPRAAEGIDPNNHQRLIRAVEVWEITGEPISSFWAKGHHGLLPELGGELIEHALVPRQRTLLHRRINDRFVKMVGEGFVEEVGALYARGDLTADMTSMRCVGYRQLWPLVAGEISLEKATERGQAATRQLAKRQLTWLRGWHRDGFVREWICDDDPRDHLQALLAASLPNPL